MCVNTYVLEKLVDAWLAERRADAARIAAIEAAEATPEPARAPEKATAPRVPRWIQLPLGR